MPEIRPFRGYRYNPDRIPDMTEVLAPPYDVISPAQQEALYAKSPYNFVRVDFKKKEASADVYEAARRELDGWIRKGVFCRDAEEAIYAYLQDYRDLMGKKARRAGFISLMKLDPRKVKRHEHTLTGPKEDRSKLLETLRANLSPIFGFFEDPGRKIHSLLLESLRQKPVVDVGIDGVRHRLYKESDPGRIGRIRRLLGPKSMYIADGHHRFEVALAFARRESAKHSPLAEAASWVMTYLCAAEHNDLTIYPTHRAVRLANGFGDSLSTLLARSFTAREKPSLSSLLRGLEESAGGKARLGVALKPAGSGRAAKRFLVLEPKKKTGALDVVLADQKLIRPLLRGEEVARSSRVRYSRDPREVVRWMKSGEANLGIFLSRIPVSEVIRVSDEGVFLPQKSTYFYPKLLSGLVFYKF